MDFSDDRLAGVLDYLAKDEEWERFEGELNGHVMGVYDLEAERVRIDTTTAKSYVNVTEDGLFQFGHSKDHRPDLPQLKISQSVLDPLGIPVTTTVVSGNCADDPLYIPEIKRVRASLGTPGFLYIGDSKMGSVATRAYIAHTGDYYLCPLSATQIQQSEREQVLEPVWRQEQTLKTVYRPLTPEEIEQGEEPEALAEGFGYVETLEDVIDGERIPCREQRLVVCSFKYAKREQEVLDARIKKVREAIAELNIRGRKRKVSDADELRAAVDKILRKNKVESIVTANYHTETRIIRKRVYKERPARTVEKSQTTVESEASGSSI